MNKAKQAERTKEMHKRIAELEELLDVPGLKRRDAISSKLYSMSSKAYFWGVDDQKAGDVTQ